MERASKSKEPTPGLEPGTPSLRVMGNCLLESPPVAPGALLRGTLGKPDDVVSLETRAPSYPEPEAPVCVGASGPSDRTSGYPGEEQVPKLKSLITNLSGGRNV